MKTIIKPCGSFETLVESLSVEHDYVQFRRPPRAESATNHPVSFNENSPRSAVLLENPKAKVFSNHKKVK